MAAPKQKNVIPEILSAESLRIIEQILNEQQLRAQQKKEDKKNKTKKK